MNSKSRNQIASGYNHMAQANQITNAESMKEMNMGEKF